MTNTSAPLTLRIYQHDAGLAESLVGQQSLMAIICEALLERYALTELNAMQQGQISKLKAIENKVVEAMDGKVNRRKDLWNYFAKNGNRAEGTNVFHTVRDEDAEEARFWVNELVAD